MFKRLSLVGISILIFLIACKKELRSIRDDRSTAFRDIVYAKNINWLGQMEELKLDIYQPKSNNNNSGGHVVDEYPLVIFLHGGGFVNGDKSQGENYARELAAKGFVVASVNYRLGWTQNVDRPCASDSEQSNEAVYRALQDTRAALRFLSYKASAYKINTDWIFVTGSSAGAMTALNAAYYNNQNIDLSYDKAANKLGSLDQGNDLTNSYTIKGVISMWGSINDLDVINAGTALPTLFFHGAKDNVIPLGKGNLYDCNTMATSYGTQPIYNKLTSLGVSAVAHIDPAGGHNVYDNIFIADNSICFMRSIMSGEKLTGYYMNNEGSCK